MSTVSPEYAHRLAVAYRDMEDVKRYLAAYLELDAMQRQSSNSRYFDHCEAALIAAVVAYCRSFKSSRSDGKAAKNLLTSDIASIQRNPAFAALHHALLDRRDTAIAHGDWKHHNTELLSVQGPSVFRRVSVPDLTSGLDVDSFMQLAEAVRQDVLAMSHAIDTAAGEA